MPGSRRPTVAIVDDEPDIRELYAGILEDDYQIREAESGDDALEIVDEDVDAVLLDRRMSGLSGEDVVTHLRGQGYDLPIALLTATEPDADILELGIDDYVIKPVGIGELQDVIETLLLRQDYDQAIREWYSLASTLAALRTSKSPEELESDDRFTRAKERLDEVKRRAMDSLDVAFEAGKFEDVMTESASTERIFEDVDDEDDAGFQFD